MKKMMMKIMVVKVEKIMKIVVVKMKMVVMMKMVMEPLQGQLLNEMKKGYCQRKMKEKTIVEKKEVVKLKNPF